MRTIANNVDGRGPSIDVIHLLGTSSFFLSTEGVLKWHLKQMRIYCDSYFLGVESLLHRGRNIIQRKAFKGRGGGAI